MPENFAHKVIVIDMCVNTIGIMSS